MKQIIPNYSFSKSNGQITFTDFANIALERVLLVVNVTTGTVIYQFNDASKLGSVSTNVLDLAYDTSTMTNSDKLMIIYECKASDPVYDPTPLLPSGAATSALQSTGNTVLANILTELSAKTEPTDTQPVSASSLPLPAGAATSANQTSTNSKLDTLIAELQQKTEPTDTQPVSAASLPLPTGAATAANQASEIASLASLDGKIPASPATTAKQDTGNASLSSIDSKLPALRTTNPQENTSAIPVRLTPNNTWRTTFASVIANNVDSNYFTLLQTGSGQTVNQSGGNLVLAAGTTVNAETVIRSNQSWLDTFILRYGMNASQRIVNNNLIIELVDVIGDGLAYTINSATSVTVTIPSNPFTSANVGQSMHLGVITGAARIPGRYAIASVAGNNVTFTVAAWPASGSGTLSLFGWNYHQIIYTGATATNNTYDAQRRGWNSGATTATINTTASPGHFGQLYNDDGIAIYSDGLVASNVSFQTTQRASRVQNIPAADTPLYLQIRNLNGTVAPASGTTFTLNFVAVEEFVATPVNIQASKQVGAGAAQQAQIMNTVTVDTELPAAAALADGAANPTTPIAGAADLLFNNTTFDRYRNNVNTTTGDTGAKTTTVAGATQTNFNARGAIISIVMGAVTGTTPTFIPQLQFSDDGGTTWQNFGPAMPTISASGTHVLVVYPSNISQAAGVTPANLTTGAASITAVNVPLPRTWRLNYTIGGTTPSFTITRVGVNYIL